MKNHRKITTKQKQIKKNTFGNPQITTPHRRQPNKYQQLHTVGDPINPQKKNKNKNKGERRKRVGHKRRRRRKKRVRNRERI